MSFLICVARPLRVPTYGVRRLPRSVCARGRVRYNARIYGTRRIRYTALYVTRRTYVYYTYVVLWRVRSVSDVGRSGKSSHRHAPIRNALEIIFLNRYPGLRAAETKAQSAAIISASRTAVGSLDPSNYNTHVHAQYARRYYIRRPAFL